MKKSISIIVSVLMYGLIIFLSCYYVIVPNVKTINDTKKTKELTSEEISKLISEVNDKYLNLEKDINDKYQVKLDEIDKNYETIYSDIDTKYKNLESEISKKIINVNVAKNKEFYRNGLSKKFYELSDEWSNLQSEKGSLTSKKNEEEFETDRKKSSEKQSVNSNKSNEIKSLNDKKQGEIVEINNRNSKKEAVIRECITKIIIGLIIILIPLFYIISVFNRLTKLLNKVKESWSSVDILLKQRADLIPNVVSAVKGYSKHEKNTLTSITKARSEVINAESKKDSIDANERLGNEVSKIMMLKEEYPELKADKNFMKLQDDLSEIEDSIAKSRSIYNKNVLNYKNNLEVFPSNIIASIFGFKQELFFEIKKEEKENPTIKFE